MEGGEEEGGQGAMSGCRVLCRRHLPAVRSRLPAARPGRPDRTAAPQAKALNTKALPLLAMLQFKDPSRVVFSVRLLGCSTLPGPWAVHQGCQSQAIHNRASTTNTNKI